MNQEDFYIALFAVAVAAIAVLAFWPEGPERIVMQRMAEGDSSPAIFHGVPDSVVEQFVNYESDPETVEQHPDYVRFVGEVRQSARIALEQRRAVHP